MEHGEGEGRGGEWVWGSSTNGDANTHAQTHTCIYYASHVKMQKVVTQAQTIASHNSDRTLSKH